MVLCLTGFLVLYFVHRKQGQAVLSEIEFKFQNGAVTFTGFDDLSNVYVHRLTTTYGEFPDGFNVAPEMNIGANFDKLKECNFAFDKKIYYGTDETADSAKEAILMKNASVYDDLSPMMASDEFDFPDSRGSGVLYFFSQHVLISAFYDEDVENGELIEDATACVTPIEIFCYGVRRHGEEEIKLISAMQYTRMFQSDKLKVFALDLFEPQHFLSAHHYGYVAFDGEGHIFISEAEFGQSGGKSTQFIADILENSKFKPFDHLTAHLSFGRKQACLMYGHFPIDREDFTADKFMNAVNDGPDQVRSFGNLPAVVATRLLTDETVNVTLITLSSERKTGIDIHAQEVDSSVVGFAKEFKKCFTKEMAKRIYIRVIDINQLEKFDNFYFWQQLRIFSGLF